MDPATVHATPAKTANIAALMSDAGQTVRRGRTSGTAPTVTSSRSRNRNRSRGSISREALIVCRRPVRGAHLSIQHPQVDGQLAAVVREMGEGVRDDHMARRFVD